MRKSNHDASSVDVYGPTVKDDLVDFAPIGLLPREPLAFVLLALSLVVAIGLHEYAHALAADLQGDKMPRAMGRVTPNPTKHLDPLGTLLIFLVGFGWGKPVEFRPQAFKSKRFGTAIVALAGPLMNLTLAIGAASFLSGIAQASSGPIFDFLYLFFSINLLLAVFNLIPVPPLDGSRLLTILLPPHRQEVIFFLDRYGFLILLGLVLLGGLSFLEPFIEALGRTIFDVVG